MYISKTLDLIIEACSSDPGNVKTKIFLSTPTTTMVAATGDYQVKFFLNLLL